MRGAIELRIGVCSCIRVKGELEKRTLQIGQHRFQCKEISIPSRSKNPYKISDRHRCHFFVEVHRRGKLPVWVVEIIRFQRLGKCYVAYPEPFVWDQQAYPTSAEIVDYIKFVLRTVQLNGLLTSWLEDFREPSCS
jgi:hypothetical protein